MAVVQTLIGNIKGPQGAQGETGATGATGAAATVDVGSVTTTAYGNPAQVTNSGTSGAAVLDFVIPQGKPGEATTTMGNLTLDSITTSTASFPSPQIGDTGKIVFGKIVKFFADTVAALNSKLNTANVANNLTTTTTGYALDARQGKALNDALSNLSISVVYRGQTANLSLNQNVIAEYDGIGVYVVEVNSDASHTAASYLRDTTTNAYVACFTGVAANGGTHAIGFPMVKGHTYTNNYAAYTGATKIQFYEIKIS